MKILRKGEKVKLTIEGVEMVISPLTYRDRVEISTGAITKAGEPVKTSYLENSFLLIKKCLKEIRGLKDHHGNDYALSFDENGDLEDDCAEEILICLQGEAAVSAFIEATRGTLGVTASGAELTILGK